VTSVADEVYPPARDAFEAKKYDEKMVPPAKPEKEKPQLSPTQKAAREYLEGLGFEPQHPPPKKADNRAGKRPPPANQPEPRLSARQFTRARKHRWERSAGFLREMKRELGDNARLTMKEWQPLWDAFWQRPVGGSR
jgi:hypothetical protein